MGAREGVCAPALDARPRIVGMLSEDSVRALLEPFGVALAARQAGQLSTYLDLLLRWNKKINLTSVRTEEECVTRHFGESLALARWLTLEGRLLDVGSGAGFPGLALKIVFPDLVATLLEPIAKKRAFLKEVARACQMTSVEVRSERLEQYRSGIAPSAFDVASARAVGGIEQLIPLAARFLKTGGHLCLWLSLEQVEAAKSVTSPIQWSASYAMPQSRQRIILVGTRMP